MHGFKYLHLNLHNHDEAHTEIINRVFDIWECTFSKVAADNNRDLDPDEFFRSHHIGVLMFQDEIVGFNLFTMFDLSLRSAGRHRYFRGLGDCSPGRLNDKNINRILTMEYLTITPQWRKLMRETPWGEILTGLGLKYMDRSNADAVIGTPRMDLRMHELCYRLGAMDFQDPVDRLDYKCAVVLFPKEEQRTFLNPLTQKWVRTLATEVKKAPLNVLADPIKESA